MIRKLFVCPYFGELPQWMDSYRRDMARLKEQGYDWLIDQDLHGFKSRCRDKLGIDCPIQPRSSKVHDYRAVLGVLYEEEILGYEFWGHTDFDIVYGNPANLEIDSLLDELDCHSDGWDYVNGPWTLYRNTDENRYLYTLEPNWKTILEHQATSGWVETIYSQHVKRALGPRMLITNLQTQQLNHFHNVRFDGDRLLEGDTEVLLAHFRRTKIYPPQLLEGAP